ncbi:MAG: hypothetical protein J6S14_20905 [Clostridia bacterium]|nr:hypothetical protein [Clostridia bacterium]
MTTANTSANTDPKQCIDPAHQIDAMMHDHIILARIDELDRLTNAYGASKDLVAKRLIVAIMARKQALRALLTTSQD